MLSSWLSSANPPIAYKVLRLGGTLIVPVLSFKKKLFWMKVSIIKQAFRTLVFLWLLRMSWSLLILSPNSASSILEPSVPYFILLLALKASVKFAIVSGPVGDCMPAFFGDLSEFLGVS